MQPVTGLLMLMMARIFEPPPGSCTGYYRHVQQSRREDQTTGAESRDGMIYKFTKEKKFVMPTIWYLYSPFEFDLGRTNVSGFGPIYLGARTHARTAPIKRTGTSSAK